MLKLQVFQLLQTSDHLQEKAIAFYCSFFFSSHPEEMTYLIAKEFREVPMTIPTLSYPYKYGT